MSFSFSSLVMSGCFALRWLAGHWSVSRHNGHSAVIRRGFAVKWKAIWLSIQTSNVREYSKTPLYPTPLPPICMLCSSFIYERMNDCIMYFNPPERSPFIYERIDMIALCLHVHFQCTSYCWLNIQRPHYTPPPSHLHWIVQKKNQIWTVTYMEMQIALPLFCSPLASSISIMTVCSNKTIPGELWKERMNDCIMDFTYEKIYMTTLWISYMKESIWLHYARKCIFNPPEKNSHIESFICEIHNAI